MPVQTIPFRQFRFIPPFKKHIAVKATILNGKKDDGGIGESNRFQTINDHMSQLQE